MKMQPMTVEVEIVLATTHRFGDSGLSLCCNRTAFELPPADRMTVGSGVADCKPVTTELESMLADALRVETAIDMQKRGTTELEEEASRLLMLLRHEIEKR